MKETGYREEKKIKPNIYILHTGKYIFNLSDRFRWPFIFQMNAVEKLKLSAVENSRNDNNVQYI